MLATTGVKMSGSEKKANRNTYNCFPIKRVTRKFLEVSPCSRAKQRQRNIKRKPKKKSFFWLIRKKGVLHVPRFFFFFFKLERLPFVWKTRKFRGELKWNGLSRWKFSGNKTIPFEVLPFSRFCRNNRNFLYHLFVLPMSGFKSRESEKFTSIL